jgi:hypothetical protein
MLATLLVPTAIVVGVLVGASGPDGPDAPPPAAPASTSAAPARTPADFDPPPPSRPIDAHQRMLEQMRVSVNPQMNQTMSGDPLADSAAELAEIERQVADIDRMLGREP